MKQGYWKQISTRFNRLLAHIMDLEPPFYTKNVIFASILANFGPEIRSTDLKYDSDWYETIVG